MADLELARSGRDRRLYELGGVGTLRVGGLLSRSASATAGAATWSFTRRGLTGASEASDAMGVVVGTFAPARLRRGGTLRWGGRDYALRPASRWKQRYALADGDRELAVLDGKGWGKRPVAITVDDPHGVDAGVLLYAAFVVRGLAEDASGAAG